MPQDRGYKRKHRSAEEGFKGVTGGSSSTADDPITAPARARTALNKVTYDTPFPEPTIRRRALSQAIHDSTQAAKKRKR